MKENSLETFTTVLGLGSINMFVLMQNIQSFFAFLTVSITLVIALIKLREILRQKTTKK